MVNYVIPNSLNDALDILSAGQYMPYAGGTDINSRNIKGKDLLFIGKLPELKNVFREDGFVHIGAAVTYSDAEKNPLVPEIIKTAIHKVAGPAIRNLGTFGGNLGNASGKADSALVNLTLGAKLHVQSADSERYLNMSDFYHSRGVTDLKKGELITEILIPDCPWHINYYYDKVSVRSAVAISNVSIAAVWEIRDDMIKNLALGIGSATDYPIRITDLENEFIGVKLENVEKQYDAVISKYIDHLRLPPDRTGEYYRRRVTFNLLTYLVKEEFTPVKY